MYIQRSGNKYHSKTTTVGGFTYHSKFEAAYAEELALRQRAGDIASWERQVKLDLRVNGVHICNYYIDFIVTHNDGRREFVETKGFQTDTWRMKWKILEATFDDHKTGPDDSLTVIMQKTWAPPRFMRR